MKAKQILKTAAEKKLHQWCIDSGHTVKDILSKKPELVNDRRKIAKLLAKEGFTQDTIAQVMKRSRECINRYLNEK